MFQLISAAVIIVLIAADRITKEVICNTIKVNGPVKFFAGLFQLRYVENTGAAFSSFSDSTKLLSVFTLIVIAACLIVLLTHRFKSVFVNICLILIVSGGIGNEIDRFARGFVIDFIEPLFMNFAVFNFADCCITVGAFMLVGYEIVVLIKDIRLKKDD